MKKKIVGLSERVFSWKDKKTGATRYGFNLCVEAPARGYVGLKVSEIFVDDSFPSFGDVANCIDNGHHDLYIGTVCNIEYNENGYIDLIEFNPKPLNKS